MNLKMLKAKAEKLLEQLPLETDCFITKNDGIKYLYLHFNDRDDEYSASKAANYFISTLRKGTKFAAPIGFDSYKTLIWVPENQKLDKMKFSDDEKYKLKVVK